MAFWCEMRRAAQAGDADDIELERSEKPSQRGVRGLTSLLVIGE